MEVCKIVSVTLLLLVSVHMIQLISADGILSSIRDLVKEPKLDSAMNNLNPPTPVDSHMFKGVSIGLKLLLNALRNNNSMDKIIPELTHASDNEKTV